MTETDVGAKRVALLMEIQERLVREEPEDVSWVCATMAGHCTGVLSGNDPAAFAYNLNEVQRVLRERAAETFGGPESSGGRKA